MGNKIYVGNLSYNTQEDELRSAFAAYGQMDSVRIISDRDTGRSKGFGFVEMSTAEEASAVIAGLNNRELGGRTLRVNVANERPR